VVVQGCSVRTCKILLYSDVNGHIWSSMVAAAHTLLSIQYCMVFTGPVRRIAHVMRAKSLCDYFLVTTSS
jgi:hypothetical protein